MTKSTRIVPTSYGVGVHVDRMNCIVRAAANCTGKDYGWLHERAKECGRKDRKGATSQTVIDFHNRIGVKLVSCFGTTINATWYAKKYGVAPQKGMTLGKFIAQNPRGSFIVGYRGHHTCVVDGQIIDSFSQDSGKFISAVWTI